MLTFRFSSFDKLFLPYLSESSGHGQNTNNIFLKFIWAVRHIRSSALGAHIYSYMIKIIIITNYAN